MFLFKRGKKRQSGLVSVQVNDDGVAVACVQGADELQLTFAEFLTGQPELISSELTALLDSAQLKDTRCSIVLSGGEYQLLLVEAPDVPESEMKEALLWRIKDLIHYSTDDTLIDYFELPEDAFRGRGKMLYAVAAQRSLVEKRVQWVESVGLVPTYVDIPELALLNLTEELCASEMGTVVLYLDEQYSFLNILSNHALYLTRSLPQGGPSALESTVLDLQRSMDYFESQIGKPPCVNILLLPSRTGETELIQELNNSLSADVQPFELHDSLLSDIALTIELQENCLLAIAGAFSLEARIKR